MFRNVLEEQIQFTIFSQTCFYIILPIGFTYLIRFEKRNVLPRINSVSIFSR